MKIIKFLFPIGLFLIINPFLNFLPAYNEIKFIGVPFLGILAWMAFKPSLIRLDYFHLVFLFFCFLSITQVKIISLVWQPLFSWIAIIFFSIGARAYLKERKKILEIFLQASFLSMIILIGTGVLKNIPANDNQAWVDYCSQNINYASVIPTVLSPSFLFAEFNKKWIEWTKPLFIFILWYFAYYFSSGLGIGLIALISMLYLIKVFYKTPKSLLKRILSIVIILIGTTIAFYLVYKNIGEFSTAFSVREQNYFLSWKAFLESPLLGKGLGNWFFFMQDYMHLLDQPYAHPSPMFSHSFVERMFSEIGIIGFSCFFLPFLITITQSVRLKKYLSTSNVMMVIIFGTFFTFRPAESNEQTYNEIPLWLFLILAQANTEKKTLQVNFQKLSLVVLCLATVWSCYWFYNNHQYLRSIRDRKNQNFEMEAARLKKIYHPIFRTIVGSDLFVVKDLLATAESKLPEKIESDEIIILSDEITKDLNVKSKEGVILKPGFVAPQGKTFSAQINPD